MKANRAVVTGLMGWVLAMGNASADVVVYPAPKGEKPSKAFGVTVNGKEVFVYRARVREEIDKRKKGIWSHKHGGPTEWASFAQFDFAGKVAVEVRPAGRFKTARVVPASYGITPEVRGGAIRFSLEGPRQVTVLLDGRYDGALHLFANPLEADRPRADDPNVIYFAPGVHEIGTTRVGSGKTVYIAGGAIVRGKILPTEKGRFSERLALTFYEPILAIEKARGVRIRGRGILDGGLIPHAGKAAIRAADSADIDIEGIIIRNSPNWAVSFHGCRDVRVANVKQISGRLNSDGINPVNSRKVRIRDCFIRNRDDSIAVKATRAGAPCEDILAERCVIWNDWGFAMGITYETRSPIRNVTFRDSDVLHAEMWALGVYVVDSATVSDVRFEGVRIEHAKQAIIRVQVGKDFWAKDKAFGRIRGVRFENVSFTGQAAPPSTIAGRDADHRVEDVTIRNLRIAGRVVTDAAAGRFQVNRHTRNIRFLPR